MPFISRRAQAEQAAAMTILRNRITELQDDLRQTTDGNVVLARHAGAADAALTVEAASLRNAHKAVLDRCKRLEEQIDALRAERDQLRKDRDRLQSRLDNALGYSPAQIRVLDAGGDAAAARAAAAEKASATR
jgi:chromosome condensin MukBEF ATPase and DNA-binding subunit MukB